MLSPEELPNQLSSKIRVNAETGCWEWTAARNHGGYGIVGFRGRTHLAHRLIFSLLRGAATADTLDHLCRTRRCTNPEHLEPVAFQENVKRGESFSARNARKTHCVHGHSLSDAHHRKSGGRDCRACHKNQQARWNAKNAARNALTQSAWYERNRARAAEAGKAYRERTREKQRERAQAYYLKNRDALLAKQREQYAQRQGGA